MTGPIIDPMWFYWLQVFDLLGTLLVIAGAFVIIIGATIFYVFLNSYEEDQRKLKYIMIALFVFGIILVVAGIMTPTKETMIQMEIARHVTYESTGTVIQTITNTASDLLEKLTEGGK